MKKIWNNKVALTWIAIGMFFINNILEYYYGKEDWWLAFGFLYLAVIITVLVRTFKLSKQKRESKKVEGIEKHNKKQKAGMKMSFFWAFIGLVVTDFFIIRSGEFSWQMILIINILTIVVISYRLHYSYKNINI